MERFAVISFGVTAAAGQVYLLRELMVATGGNELFAGFFFAAWLLGIAAGAAAGGVVSERGAVRTAFALSVAAFLLFHVSVASARAALIVFDVPAGTRLPAAQCALLSLLAVLPFASVIGALFPAASLMLRRGNGGASAAGTAFWVEGAGMASGSLLATFVLAPNFDPFSGMHAVFLALFLTFCLPGSPSRPIRVSAAVAVAAVIAHLLCGGPGRIEETSAARRFDSLGTGFERVGGLNTRYARYDLGLRSGQYALYINGQFVTAFPDDYSCAPRAHLFMSEAGSPGRVLILGAASFCMVAHVLEQGAQAVDYVETDPDLLPFLERAAGGVLVPRDPRVRVRFTDGRAFVKSAPPRYYDLVVADVPDPSTASLNRYYTLEFYREVAGTLAPGGVFATGVQSSATYLGDASASHLGSVHRALRSVFPHVQPTAGVRSYLMATAHPGLLTADGKVLRDRYARSGAADSSFVPETLDAFFPEGRVEGLEKRLYALDAPQNTDRRPAAYLYNLVLWDWTTGGGFSGALPRMAGVTVWHAAAAAAALFALLGAAALLRRTAPVPAAAVLMTAGFFGMAAEVLCLFAFQNHQGNLYSQVGLLVAFYMGGMTAGGYAGARAARTCAGGRTEGALSLGIALCALWALLVPAASGLLAGRTGAAVAAGFAVLAGAAGALSGFCFPVAAAVFGSCGCPPSRVAALTDALDCLGAAPGALLAAVLLLPVTGIGGTSLLLALACALAGVLQFLFRGGR